MKLKEIKPGMLIHFESGEDMEKFIELDNRDSKAYDFTNLFKAGSDCIYIRGNGSVQWNIGMKSQYSEELFTFVEFSDLIIPDEEMSAEELLIYLDR